MAKLVSLKILFPTFQQIQYSKSCNWNNIETGPEVCNFIKKETLAQVFSCEFCEISKNAFFHRTPPVAAFGNIARN